MPASQFSGFPSRILGFFEELAENNNKTWFDAHKEEYEQCVKEPALALGDDIASGLAEFAAGPSPRASMFRIYRDIRFSKDKSPYKTYLGIGFAAPGRKLGESPGFYFHLSDGRVMLGGGLHVFPKPALDVYRQAVTDEKEALKLARVLADVKAKGYAVGGQTYKKTPRGYDAAGPSADLLRYGGLFASLTVGAPAELHDARLVEFCLSHFRRIQPLQAWLVDFEERRGLGGAIARPEGASR
jgi:uncharacterized protein (TIGR02453 family)